MWPALVPGDVLRAARIRAGDLVPGDILVLEAPGADPRVHRLVRVETGDDGALLLSTGGDRSGPDGTPLRAAPGEELRRLEAVLRRGRWRRPSRRASRMARGCPAMLVSLHCGLVRRLAWSPPAGLTAVRGESSNRREG